MAGGKTDPRGAKGTRGLGKGLGGKGVRNYVPVPRTDSAVNVVADMRRNRATGYQASSVWVPIGDRSCDSKPLTRPSTERFYATTYSASVSGL